MAKQKGYKRGLSLFLIISIGTFALMFLFANQEQVLLSKRKIVYLSVKQVNKKVTFPKSTDLDTIILKNLQSLSNQQSVKTIKIKPQLIASVIQLQKSPTLGNARLFMTKTDSDSLFFIKIGPTKDELTCFAFIDKKSGLSLVKKVITSSQFAVHGSFQKYVSAFIKDALKGPGLLESLNNINPWFLMLAFVFWIMNVLTDSYLLKVLLRAVDDDMPLTQCIYAFLGNEFLTAVTPFQSGGQPLMVYIMHKNNVSVGKGILVTFFKTAGQIYFFALTAPVVILIWPSLINIPGLAAFYIYGVIFFGYFLTLTFFVFFKPEAAKRITKWFFNFIGRFKYFRKKNLGKGLRKALKEINVFSFFTKDIMRKKKLTFVWLFLLTALSWIFKFLIAVAIIWGLAGFVVNVFQAVSVQTVTNFLAFFAPSPGGSGVFEFSMKKIFEKVMEHKEIILIIVVIWRFITYYLSVFLGSLVVVKVLKIKQDDLEDEEQVIENDYKRSPKSDMELK